MLRLESTVRLNLSYMVLSRYIHPKRQDKMVVSRNIQTAVTLRKAKTENHHPSNMHTNTHADSGTHRQHTQQWDPCFFRAGGGSPSVWVQLGCVCVYLCVSFCL